MEMKIRPATLKDFKAIQNMNHQLCVKENKEFDATINKDYPLSKSGKAYFKKRIVDDCALVAVVDGQMAGYLVGAVTDPAEFRKVPKLAEAENMFVLEGYRSLGIGKKLFQGFIKWCKSNKVKRMRVIASAQNAKAIEFYRREGFTDCDLALERKI